MQTLETRSESLPSNDYPALLIRQQAYNKLHVAYTAIDGMFGENVTTLGVPMEVIESINSASTHAEVLTHWNRYLMSKAQSMVMH